MDIAQHFIKSGEINLWTQRLSAAENIKQTCILISGAGASAMFWHDEFCRALIAAGYTTIRFDHRDQGLSDSVDWDTAPYTINELAEDVISIADYYQLEKVHIVGHSMGGTIAQWLAIRYPQRLLSYTSMSVATCGPVGQPSQEIIDALLKNSPTQDYSHDLAGFMHSWRLLNGDYEVNREIAESYTQDLYLRSKYPVDVAWHHIWCQEQYGDLTDRLKQIFVPGLFIHGEKDPLIPLQGAIKTQAVTPNSKMVTLMGMGHMFFNLDLETTIISHLIEHFQQVSDMT